MKHRNAAWLGLFFCIFLWQVKSADAQSKLKHPNSEGIRFVSPDSTTNIHFQARMQNRFVLSSRNAANFEPTTSQFLIRRMRLKADGQLIDPRLSFKLELAFSDNDIDGNIAGRANILLDAAINYAITPSLSLRFGQFKLPGNRQRVISSGDLQLVDRSPMNSVFNYDRDVGLMVLFKQSLGQAQFIYKGAVSNGEGRNALSSSTELNNNELNLALTQRIEFFPFGAFEGGGAYFEGDLLREERPKLSIAGGYYLNNDAVRAQGQRGPTLFETRNINSFYTDFIFKYQGLSVMGEYINTQSANPITESPDDRREAVKAGSGYMLQAGYVWPSMWEIAGRYSEVSPQEEVIDFFQPESELLLGISKYLRGHRVKIQSDIGYLTAGSLSPETQDFWRWRVQMELGI
jgi:phosphate-selective porin OprO/OprP